MKKLVVSAQNSLYKVTEICRERDYGIEVLSFSGPEYLLNNPDGIKIHKQVFKGLDVRTIHGPFTLLQPGSSDESLSAKAEKEILYSLEKARELKASHLIVHHGEILDTDPVIWIANSISFWKRILLKCNNEIRIHMENVRDKNPDILQAVITGVNDEMFDICLDTGHAKCYSDMKAESWILQLKSCIGYVHLHNNDGTGDGHLGLPNGSINMPVVCEYLEKYCPDAIWTVEVHDEYIDESLLWLAEKGYTK